MLSHEFSHIPSLPHHTHVIERAKRAKATLGRAEASEVSQVGEASEASEPTCIYTQTLADIKAHTAGLLPRAKALGN